ncbi:MAG: MATE family efflux transporter [Kiritimatiellia bacterium]
MSLFNRSQKGNVVETLKIAWPLMLAQVANAFYDICDGWFLARSSAAAFAASLPSNQLAISLTTFFICSIGYMMTVFVAQLHGGGHEKEAVSSFAQGLWMSLFVLPVFGLLVPVSWWVVDCAGHPVAVAAAEKTYLSIRTPGSFFLLLNMVLGGVITGQGRTFYVSLCTLVGVLVNCGGDAALINGLGPIPALGIQGAALATVGGYASTALMLGWGVGRDPLIGKFRGTDAFRFRPESVRQILRYGAPMGATAFISSLSFTIFMLVLTSLGTVASNAANVAFKVNNVFYMVLCATADSTLILTGRHHGSGDDAAARRSYKSGLCLVFFTLAVCFLLIFLFLDPIMDAFRSTDLPCTPEEYHALGAMLFLIMFFREAAEGVMCLTVGALRGVGDTEFVMWTQMACDFGFWMPLVLLIGRFHPTLRALWLTMPVYLALVAAILVWRWRSGAWRRISLLPVP